MSPYERDIIERKLAVIVVNLEALAPVSAKPLEEYTADLIIRKAAERMLQEIIEAAIDINAHLLASAGGGVPDDYFTSFTRMAEQGILAGGLAQALAPSAGLRNRLVHEYDELDNGLILKALAGAQELYTEYVRQIKTLLDKDDKGGRPASEPGD